MSNIRFVKGNLLSAKEGLIIHGCNDIGVMGAGVALSIKNKWPIVYQKYRKWFHETICDDIYEEYEIFFQLGELQIVPVGDKIWVGNGLTQKGIATLENQYSKLGIPPIRYEAVRDVLVNANIFCERYNTQLHMPRIGCGLAGGKWDKIFPMIEKYVKVPVTIYDLNGFGENDNRAEIKILDREKLQCLV